MRRLARLAVLAAFVLALPAAADAGTGDARSGGGTNAYVSPALLAEAKAHPDASFDVIVQGEGRKGSAAVASDVRALGSGNGVGVLRRQFAAIAGVAAELTGKQILKLAEKKGISAITEDAAVTLAGTTYNGDWQFVAGLPRVAKAAPTIAVIDSGVDASRADFRGRIVERITMTALTPNSPGDGRGHGTFVASIAAGASRDYPGMAPGAKILSIDVMDDRGMAMTRDVIAAADWIYRNKDRYGVRVANFSLHSSVPSSFMFDPLDKAVEKLWFSGVVVVASSGNYAVNGQASGVPFAPGNDPFIITVGANDIAGSRTGWDDSAAPWSAYGYTLDGFAKPELAAPGRYMVGAVPTGSTMALERPDRIVAPGYMWMSGTSFAAPVVAGAAAHVLAAHPTWTPDQVKGALMLKALSVQSALPLSTGVGEAHAAGAAGVSDPPNPNLALNRFLVADPGGGSVPVFDAASWANVAMADASWANASWANASWANASWSAASWANASWANASWATASWAAQATADASWASASWAHASWASASWAAATTWVE